MNADALVARAKQRPELAVPLVVLLSTLLFPKRAPLGIYVLGLVSASILVLPAIGLILVFRSNRIVNFSQVVIATATATLFVTLTTSVREGGVRFGFFPVLWLVTKVCDTCVDRVGTDPEFYALGPSQYLVMYLLAIALSMLVAMVLTMVCYLIVQRFAAAPRLIVTVATIFVAQVAAALAASSTGWLVPDRFTEANRVGLTPVPPPFRVEITFGTPSVTFSLTDMLTVGVTGLVVAALALYVARSKAGTAIRAAAENPARVATLGIDANRVIAKVWVVTGLLAGVSGILLGMLEGAAPPGASTLGLTLLVRILAVAVIARMSSLPVAVGAAIAIGMAEQAARWAFGSTVVLDGSLLAIIGVTLLLQFRRASRAEVEQAGAWQADREIRPIPRELRSLPTIKTWLRTLSVIGLICVLGGPWLLSAAQINLATLAVLYAMLGLSLLVLTGWAGQISLGQVALAAFGAYAAAYTGLPFVIALVVGAVAGGVAATVVGIPALRLRGLNLAIITLAFAVSTSSFLLDRRYLGKHLPRSIDRPNVLGVDLDDQRSFYYLTLVLLALVTIAVVGMRRSRTARAFIALRDNEQVAQSFGITASRARLSAFAVSGAIAGFAGALIAYADGAVDPSRFTPDLGVNLFLAMVIGGFGTVVGPFLGAVYLGVVPLLGGVGAIVNQFGGIAGLVLLVLVGGGLSQLVFRVRDNLLRRVANRYGIVVPSLVADVRTDGLAQKAPIEPKRRATGGTAFVPQRYRVAQQWAFGETVPLQQTDDDETEPVVAR